MGADETELTRDRRAARLARELRANLARRKGQARARRDGAADERPEGINAAHDFAPAESGIGESPSRDE